MSRVLRNLQCTHVPSATLRALGEEHCGIRHDQRMLCHNTHSLQCCSGQCFAISHVRPVRWGNCCIGRSMIDIMLERGACQGQAGQGPGPRASVAGQRLGARAAVAWAPGTGVWSILHRVPLYPQLAVCSAAHGGCSSPPAHPSLCTQDHCRL